MEVQRCYLCNLHYTMCSLISSPHILCFSRMLIMNLAVRKRDRIMTFSITSDIERVELKKFHICPAAITVMPSEIGSMVKIASLRQRLSLFLSLLIPRHPKRQTLKIMAITTLQMSLAADFQISSWSIS